MTRAYLDHASTTPPRPEALAALTRWMALPAADPGRLHEEGRTVRDALEQARQQVAAFFGTTPRQVVFTSGGTEAINAAVWGATRRAPGAPVLYADVEHFRGARGIGPAGADRDHPGRRHGKDPQRGPGDAPGARPPCRGRRWCTVSGPITKWGRSNPCARSWHCAADADVPVHVDAAAACGHVPMDLNELGADLVSLSAHKMGGSPGAGALVIRRGSRFEPLLVGGEQERGRRAGLEALPALIAFGAAAGALEADGQRLLHDEAARARDQIATLSNVATSEEDVDIVGPPSEAERLPYLVCLGVHGVEAEPVLIGLDRAGVAVHSGSACSSESIDPSPVLAAMGVDENHSLRVSVGWSTTDADIAAFGSAFGDVVAALRGATGLRLSSSSSTPTPSL